VVVEQRCMWNMRADVQNPWLFDSFIKKNTAAKIINRNYSTGVAVGFRRERLCQKNRFKSARPRGR